MKMNDKEEKIKIMLKKKLGANFRDGTEDVLFEIYKEMYSIALNTSHLNSRNKEELLYPYVEDATISKYLSMGAEGLSGRNEGSQSSTFIDIEDKLRNNIIKNGLRRVL